MRLNINKHRLNAFFPLGVGKKRGKTSLKQMHWVYKHRDILRANGDKTRAQTSNFCAGRKQAAETAL